MSQRQKVGFHTAMLTEGEKEALKQMRSGSKKTDEGNLTREDIFGRAIWHFRTVLFPRGHT